MSEFIHFIKHALGLCGCCPKTLFTMLLSGTGLLTIWRYYIPPKKKK